MESFAEQGMRTLVFAYRKLGRVDAEEIVALPPEYFESDLDLLGATGVEDLLQDDVKKCITDF